MSRRTRRDDGATMTLFPFLAVLICTVGALIVLLVVVMQNARATGSATGQSVAAAPTPTITQPPPTARDPIVARPEPPTEIAISPPTTSSPTNEVAKTARHENKWEEIVTQAQLERDKHLWEIELLQESRERTIARLQQKRTEVSHLEDHIRRLREELVRFDQADTALTQSQTPAADAATAELESLQAQIADAEQQVATAREQAANRKPAYMVVPYKGKHGTDRQPFYVECRGESVLIQPLGIALGVEDFREPLGPNNPLAAALRATREFMVEMYGNEVEEPYPLLIVRPDGARSFVACRRALKDWEHDLGYELVAGDMQLTYPKVAPPLGDRISSSVASSREHRANIRAMLANTAADEYGPRLRVSNSAGGFVNRDGRPARFFGGSQLPGNASQGSASQGSQTRGSQTRGSQTRGSQTHGSRSQASQSQGAGVAGIDARFRNSNKGPTAANGYSANNNSANNYQQGGSIRLNSNGFRSNDYQPNAYRPNGSGYQPNSYPAAGDNFSTNRNQAGANQVAGRRGSFAPGSPLPLPNPAGASAGDPSGSDPSGSTVGSAFPISTPSGAASDSSEDPPSEFVSNSNSTGGTSSGTPSRANGGSYSPAGSATGGNSGASAADVNAAMPANSRESLADSRGEDWALPNSTNGAIGITRPITLRVYPRHLQLNPEGGTKLQPHMIPFENNLRDAIQPLVGNVWKRIEEWGSAGPGVYWKPKLEITVDPNAEREFELLQALLRGSGLDVKRR